MKKFIAVLVCLFLAGIFLLPNLQTNAESDQNSPNLVSPNLVISQFQVRGGTHNDEFIELQNTSSSSIDLNGYRVVYRSDDGTNDVNFVAWTTSTLVPPGGYYLITSTGYDGTTPGDFTYNPSTCAWKVVLILPNGNNDLKRVTKATRTIAIIVPNQPPVNQNAPWRQFRTNVNAVEYLTSLNFFSNVPKITQEIIERRRDLQ